jgi:hypothetical protein
MIFKLQNHLTYIKYFLGYNKFAYLIIILIFSNILDIIFFIHRIKTYKNKKILY